MDDLDTSYVVADPIRAGTLSLAELMDLMASVRDVDNERTGLTEEFWSDIWLAWEDTGDPADFISVWSPFYPDLERASLDRARAWTAQQTDAEADA